MYLKIKKAALVPDKFGSNLSISMIGLYDNNGKWIKWVKLNDALLKTLLEKEIHL